MFQSCEYSGVT